MHKAKSEGYMFCRQCLTVRTSQRISKERGIRIKDWYDRSSWDDHDRSHEWIRLILVR